MQSFTASLKLWLSMQCQMLGGVSAAMLVQTTFGVPPKIVAKWPNAAANNSALREALKQVLDKKRLHLEPDGDGHFILGQPLVIDGEPWGVLLLHLQLKDKKELPAVLKNLKLGQYWLQFLLQQPDEAPPPAAVPIIDKNSASPALLQLSASLLKENSLQETAISLVNLLAGFLQATRVSLGVRHANNISLEAISFSANFDKRTQAMQAISEAMTEALEQGAAIDFSLVQIAEPTPDSNVALPVLIKHAHQQLQQQQQLQSVHSLLVRNGDVIIGVLTIELDKQAMLTDDQRSFLQQAL
ncbi:GAF domain-containing protein, partial [Cellvibrio sp.]